MKNEQLVEDEEVPQEASSEASNTQEPIEEIMQENVVHELKLIPLDQLIPHREQGTGIRIPEKFNKLVEDIRAHGLNQPILVRPIGDNKHEIVCGQNRWDAVKLIGKDETILCIVKNIEDDDSAERALTDNIHRQELPPFFLECCIYKRFNNGNYTHQSLANILDISDTWVKDNIIAHELRKKLFEEAGDYFKDFSTAAILEINKIITNYHREFRDLVEFIGIANRKHYSTTGIKRMVERMESWSEEGWNDFLYGDKSWGSINKKEIEKNKPKPPQQDPSQPDQKEDNKVVNLHNIITKKLRPTMKSMDDEEQQKAIRYLKLIIGEIGKILFEYKAIPKEQFEILSKVTSEEWT